MKSLSTLHRLTRPLAVLTALSLSLPANVFAFCGFYVGKADAQLFNKASQVVMVRNGNKTVISMLNDYEGELQEFAMVVPVPEVLKEGQIHVAEKSIFEHLDAFTAPRLVEYFDPDPCENNFAKKKPRFDRSMKASVPAAMELEDAVLGVTVEAEYTVGEYDIVILSAKESQGLETWLIQNEYNIPKGASQALKPYIKQDMKFFVAKINLKEKAKTGVSHLRPLQFAFESEKFMLPIRLGMINANGPQDLVIHVITKNGRVETTNYRTVKMPTGTDLPVFVKDEFEDFYKDMFAEQVRKESGRAVFTEYFWNMSWCDPCSADPLSPEELKTLGVFWLDENNNSGRPFIRGGAQQVMVTRLHVRYENKTFPEDLVFQETKDTQNFQGRYVIRHPWKGSIKDCEAGKNYMEGLPARFEREAQSLATLTGWDINEIRKKLNLNGEPAPWWQQLWK